MVVGEKRLVVFYRKKEDLVESLKHHSWGSVERDRRVLLLDHRVFLSNRLIWTLCWNRRSFTIKNVEQGIDKQGVSYRVNGIVPDLLSL
jgi:hypothetical protein